MDAAVPPSAIFSHIVFKSLSAVEADASRSNQHEFNGTLALRAAFGREAQRIDTDFIWMPDHGRYLAAKSEMTWYDARARHPVRSEYRLYYRPNEVMSMASEGDILLIALKPDGSALTLVAPESGRAAARLYWLFGIEIAPGAAFASINVDDHLRGALAERLGLTGQCECTEWDADPVSWTMQAEDDRVRNAAASVQKKLRAIDPVQAADAEWTAEEPVRERERFTQAIRELLLTRNPR